MNVSAKKFAALLTEAIQLVKVKTQRPIQQIQDEIGHEIGRNGGSSIEYWRKGNVPKKLTDVEDLAKALAMREGLTVKTLRALLVSAGHPDPQPVIDKILSICSLPDDETKRERHPFVVGPPIGDIQQFFGREKMLGSIFNLWMGDPLLSVVVLGPRRSGRTSLLYRLERMLQNLPACIQGHSSVRFRTVYIDFHNPFMTQRESLLAYILSELELPPLSSSTNSISQFMRLMTTELKTSAVLLLDDIQAGLAAPELDADFWWSWRALCNRGVDGKLAFVVTATQPPIELARDYGKPSPFFNIFSRTEYLGPFNEVEARQLIDNSPIRFPEADIVWMLEQSRCWPAPLQCLSQLRLEALRANDETDQWREQGVRQLEQFVRLFKSTEPILKVETKRHFRVLGATGCPHVV